LPLVPQDPDAAYKRLLRAVQGTRTVTAQLNLIARQLASYRYAKAFAPTGHEAGVVQKSGERPVKLQFFVWLDTPYGDDLILATGPSFKPLLALGRDIPADPGVGIYALSLLSRLKGDQTAGMHRAADRAGEASDAVERSERGGGRATRPEKPARVPKPAASRVAPEPERAKPPSRPPPRPVPTRSYEVPRESVITGRQRAEARRAEEVARAAEAEAKRKAEVAERAAAKLAEESDNEAANKELASFAAALRKEMGL
jgi:hypothetical protein